MWLAKEDGTAFAYGSACYDWDKKVCPTDVPFASINENYDNVGKFSYFT